MCYRYVYNVMISIIGNNNYFIGGLQRTDVSHLRRGGTNKVKSKSAVSDPDGEKENMEILVKVEADSGDSDLEIIGEWMTDNISLPMNNVPKSLPLLPVNPVTSGKLYY